jgi:methionyl-tRNA formyltransferase
MRLVFMGTPNFAVPTLRRLHQDGHDIAAVYCRAPKPAGRGMALSRSPVHVVADELGIPVETPRTLRDEVSLQRVAAYGAEVGIVVAYGMILPNPILAEPRHGFLNIHASLLPRWRGAAPMQRAIMAGDAQTGVAIMRVEEKLDAGPVAREGRVPIDENETAGELLDHLPQLGARLMAETLRELQETGTLAFTPQDEAGVTYAEKISKEETRIDWRRPATEVHNHIRGLSPFPGAWFEADFGRGPERIKVLRAVRVPGVDGAPGTLLDIAGVVACGDGAVRLVEIQRAGKQPMSFSEFSRGARLNEGMLFG